MRVALTGGSGFVGGALLERLLEAGLWVHALARSRAQLPSHPRLQVFEGELPDRIPPGFLAGGVRGLYHLAALYLEGPAAAAALQRCNVGGTEALLGAARLAGVQRFVYCSTMGTCGPRADGAPATEEDFPEAAKLSAYNRSKWEAERLVLAAEGLETVVANPGAPLGAGDARPTVTGQRVLDLLAGRMPRLLTGPINYLPVSDLAVSLIALFERGRPGERYLLGGENLGPEEFIARASAALQVPVPKRSLGDRLRGRRRLSPGQLAIDDRKARIEIGHRSGSLEEAIAAAGAFYRSRPRTSEGAS